MKISTVVLAIVQQHKAKRQECAHPFNISPGASVFGGPYLLLLSIVHMWCRSVTASEGQVDAEVGVQEAAVTEPNDANSQLGSEVLDLVQEAHAVSSGESCMCAARLYTLAQVWKQCSSLLSRQLIADSYCAADAIPDEEVVSARSDSSCHSAGQLLDDGSLMHR